MRGWHTLSFSQMKPVLQLLVLTQYAATVAQAKDG